MCVSVFLMCCGSWFSVTNTHAHTALYPQLCRTHKHTQSRVKKKSTQTPPPQPLPETNSTPHTALTPQPTQTRQINRETNSNGKKRGFGRARLFLVFSKCLDVTGGQMCCLNQASRQVKQRVYRSVLLDACVRLVLVPACLCLRQRPQVVARAEPRRGSATERM